MLVVEPVEHAGLLESAPGLLGVVDRVELEHDEDVVGVVDPSEHALGASVLAARGPSLSNKGRQVS